MRKSLYLFVCVTLLLTGCKVREQPTYIEFIKADEVEYIENFNACNLIEQVEEYKKEDFKIKENSIELPNNRTVMCNSSKKEIELDTISFEFTYRGSSQIKKVKIIDTTPPTFSEIKDTYVVEKDNKYFDLKNLITVEDNFDKKLELFFNGSYDVNKVGKYEVEVVVSDSNDNKTSKMIVVEVEETIKEVEKETVVIQPTSPTNTPNSNNGTSSGNTTNNALQGSNGGIVEQTLPSKTFNIDTYNSFDECMRACNQYITGSNGLCTPYKKDGVYYGYTATFQ